MSTAPPATPHSAFSGTVMGGESPVIWSQISLYETTSTGTAQNSPLRNGVYGPASLPTPLGTTFTDINGNFNFATPVHCSNSNNFVYAVAAGGNTGSYPGTVNANALEMATVGSCATLSGSTFILINEVSTVAAAYALSGFTSVVNTYQSTYIPRTADVVSSANGVLTLLLDDQVTITYVSGQPITLTGCTDVGGNTLTQPTAGYFIQTETGNLFTIKGTVNSAATKCTFTSVYLYGTPTVSVSSTATNFSASGAGTPTSAAGLNHAFANAANLQTNGTANTTVPGQPFTVVPRALINTIANALQACVNSTGELSSTQSGQTDSTVCGRLAQATIETSFGGNSASQSTLQAALGMAKFPTQNVATIVGLASATGPFQPTLTSTPPDLSIAIQYLSGYGATPSSGTNGLKQPFSLTLDGNDNVYVLNTASDPSAGQVANIVSLTSSGQPLWSSTPAQGGVGGITTDLFGNLFASFAQNNAMTGINTGVVNEYSESGVLEQTPLIAPSGVTYSSITSDAAGDLYVAPYNTLGATTANIQYFQRTGNGAGSFPSTPTVTGNSGNIISSQMFVKLNGSVFFPAVTFSGNTPIGYLSALPYATNSSSYDQTEFVQTDSNVGPYGTTAVTLDVQGFPWTAGSDLAQYVGGSVNGTSQLVYGRMPTVTLPNNSYYVNVLGMDGNNAVWGGSSDGNGNGQLFRYNQAVSHPSVIALNPCVVATQAACTTVMQFPQTVAVDSTGSVWVADATSVFQIVGAASPAWPVVAKQTPGVMP